MNLFCITFASMIKKSAEDYVYARYSGRDTDLPVEHLLFESESRVGIQAEKDKNEGTLYPYLFELVAAGGEVVEYWDYDEVEKVWLIRKRSKLRVDTVIFKNEFAKKKYIELKNELQTKNYEAMRNYTFNGTTLPIDKAPSVKEQEAAAKKETEANPHDNFASPDERVDENSDHFEGEKKKGKK